MEMSLKTKLLFIFFLGALCTVNAQERIYVLKGKILDQKTSKPLSGAAIIYGDKSIGVISDDYGEFRLRINTQPQNTLSISYLGYKTRVIKISDFLKLNDGIVYLEEGAIALNTVILEDKQPETRSPKQLFKEVQRNFERALPKYSYISSASYTEKIESKENYVLFAQSLGYALNMEKLPGATFLSKYKFFNKNTKLAIDSLWMKNFKRKHGEAYSSFLSGSANVNQYLRLIKYGVLSKKWRHYTFKLDSTYYQKNQKVYRISFEGERANGYLNCYAKSLKLFKIVYTTNDFPSGLFNKGVKAKVAIAFNYFNENVFISEMTSSYHYKDIYHTNTLHVLAQKFSEFKMNSAEYWGLTQLASNPYIDYTPDEWRTLGVKKDEDIKKIKADLGSEIPLEIQFKNNSGKRLRTTHADSYAKKAILKIKELENLFLYE